MDSPGQIRVLIVDYNELLRSGLRVFLEVYEDLKLVGEAGDGREALERCERLLPDVVLMDWKMPIMDGITATRLIRQKFPQTAVVMLYSYAPDGHADGETLEAGAHSYLHKSVTLDKIADAIRAAAQSVK